MKTDFDRAYVHDGKIIVRTNPYGEMTPIDESFPIRLKSRSLEQTELYLPGYTIISLSKKVQRRFVKSVVVNP